MLGWIPTAAALSLRRQFGRWDVRLEDSGGMVRVGLAHYNTKEEVDRFLATLAD